nr:ent-kaur-16-ene synthase, chloroplastic-like [Spinacia oleracea]
MSFSFSLQQLRCSPCRPTPAFIRASCSFNRTSNDDIQKFEDAKEKIRKMFQKVELSVSAYDTAWVAMVPSPATPNTPCFPGRSVDWILENQLCDGSWGLLDYRDASLVKDSLSSTLACVLALKRCCINFCNEVILQLAKDDFSYCQSIHLQEFKQLKRWVAESKLDQLTFSRKKLSYCYFSAAASFSSPELTDARISWAKNSVLTTVVDDFFDVGSSKEEQLNLIQLVTEWNANKSIQTCSENVHIIFSALKDTISDIGDKAYRWQDHSITKHLVEIWLSLIKSMWKEAEMVRNRSIPTEEEYMENGYISFALGPIVLPVLYFIGPKLSEEVIKSDEYHNLFKLMSTCGRLLNDYQGCQREAEEGKLNAVSLRIHHENGTISKEDAIGEIKQRIEDKRRELLRMVLRGDGGGGGGGVVPKDCREVFWKMSKVLHFFYMKEDGFTSDEMAGAVKAVLHDPIDRM